MTDREHITTGGVIWGCLWRTSRYGVLLGVGFGGFYIAAFGTQIFPVVGTVYGFFFGALAGAVVGLPLSLLDGLLLSWIAASYRNVGHQNPRRFPQAAGIVCEVGPSLALLSDWALHDLPDPDGFAVFRANLLVLDLVFPTKSPDTGVPLDVISLSIWVFALMLMVLVASWLTGRNVARWYIGEVSET